MSSLYGALTAILDRAQADGLAVVPIDVLRELLQFGARPAPPGHEIVFPGPTATWLMRHPADCTDLACRYAAVARRQFPPHDGCFAPGEHLVQLAGHHLITHQTAKG